MIKRIFYIPVLIISLFTACSEQIPEPDTNGGGSADGEVLINILPPRISTSDDQLTRAITTAPMPAGSTIRLFIYDATASDADNNPYSNNRLIKKEMAFRVRSEGEIKSTPSDQRVLVPCEVNEKTGAFIKDITDTDLHLPSSDYDFFAISPAVQLNTRDIDGYDVPAYRFQHGGVVANTGDIPITFYTTKPLKKIQVRQDHGQVTGGTSGVYNLQLEPFTLLSSRVRFVVIRGEDVETMQIEKRGVVMSNMTYDAFRTNFFIGDQKLREIILTEDDAVFGTASVLNARNVEGLPKGYEAGTHDKSDTWELITEVIPNPDNNAPNDTLRRRDVKLTFHLLINGGNYKSYESVLKEQRFERGSEYTYEVTVNAGGIFVRGWRNAEWTVTIPL